MEETLYCIWLSQLFPCGNNKPSLILNCCESAEAFYRMPEEEKAALGFLNARDLTNIRSTSLKRAERILRQCEEKKIRVIVWSDPEYPKRLRLIYAPPVVLYALGDLSGLNESLAITVVGTRQATDYSVSVTQWLAKELVEAGTIVVSGCAVGIDTAAHQGALLGHGRTIGVLGCGMDVDYPKENHSLKASIIKNGGALLTELPPQTPAMPKYFPVRNRILAGLSAGVLVTHAPNRSGSLITANHAIEQGKEVFCVPPYSLFDPEFSGVNRYLRDGAVPVFCASDILAMYTGAYAHMLDVSHMEGDYAERMEQKGRLGTIHKQPAPETQPEAPSAEENKRTEATLRQKYVEIISGFDEKHLAVYNNLELTPKFIDELAQGSGCKIGELLSILTELEILGLAESQGGQRFSLAKLAD